MKKIFLIIALVATLTPTLFVVHEVGGQNWHGVLPKGTTDSLYYYARIHEVVDWHLLNGNPYIYEYRNTLAPAFFVPDIISALPMLIGIPFNIGIMLNVFIWSFILLLFTFTLFKRLSLPKWWAFGFTLILFVNAYSFMLRPTIMQLIYPLFILFFITLLNFLNEPQDRKRMLYLAGTASLTFYFYSYLSYIVLFTLVFTLLWYLFTKRFAEVKSLIWIAIISAIMLVPFGIYTWFQIQGPYYSEILARIGLVHTHFPSPEAFLYARWLIIGLAATLLLKSKYKVFWFSSGLALFISTYLNVLTGIDVLLGVHIGRFIVLWMVLILGSLCYEAYISRSYVVNKYKYLVGVLMLLALFFGVARNAPRGLDFFKFNNRGEDRVGDIQSYAGPLRWLRENVSEEAVIWANKSVSQYIPIMTQHYPLFSQTGVLHNVSQKELEDRYLLTKSRTSLKIETMKKDFGLYSGKLPLQGEDYFNDLEKRFKDIELKQKEYLKKFNVEYYIVDKYNDGLIDLSLDNALYDDGRFAILPLPLQ